MTATVLELRTWGRKSLADRGVESPQLDADLLLAACLRCTREMLLARAELAVPHVAEETFRSLVRRRCEREPVAYLLGRKEFFGVEFFVSPAVLIPRPETEILIEQALLQLKTLPSSTELMLIDVGTGSGAIVLTLLREIEARFELSTVRALAIDLDEAALEVARINAEQMGLKDRLRLDCSDLLKDVPQSLLEGDYALIAANLPYIADGDELPPDVEKFEPRTALRGGESGTELVRALIDQVLDSRPCGEGCLVLEIGHDQCGAFEQMLEGRKECSFSFVEDLQGHPRVLKILYRQPG